MIEINLLPGGVQKKVPSAKSSIDFAALGAKFSGLGDKVLLGSMTVVVLALGAGAVMFLKQQSDRSAAEERLTQAQSDSTRYASVMAQRVKLEAKRDTLLRQVNLIKAIDDDRFIWPHIMDEVSRVLPPYTWITVMAYGGTPAGSINVVAPPPPPKANAADKDKPKPRLATTIPRDDITVRITGRTVDIMALTRFMSDLENSPFIASVFMENTTPSPDQGKDAYMFQLTVKYARPDSMLVQRLPLASTIR